MRALVYLIVYFPLNQLLKVAFYFLGIGGTQLRYQFFFSWLINLRSDETRNLIYAVNTFRKLT